MLQTSSLTTLALGQFASSGSSSYILLFYFNHTEAKGFLKKNRFEVAIVNTFTVVAERKILQERIDNILLKCFVFNSK